jgi:cyclophilin family peptidyl-prolyl cis-trans isomerase
MPKLWIRTAGTFVDAVLVLGCSRGAERSEKLQAPSPLEIFGTPNPHADIAVRLETTEGVVHCTLSPAGAPRGVAAFIGLATGRASFRDVRTGKLAKRPYYDGLAFFRAIPSVLVQSGCPRGDGTGHPGFRVPVEARAGDEASLRSPGVLVLARYTRRRAGSIPIHPFRVTCTEVSSGSRSATCTISRAPSPFWASARTWTWSCASPKRGRAAKSRC